MRNLVIAAFVLALGGCTILREYPRRSEIQIKTTARNPVDQPERTEESTLTLHGSNRDVLRAYLDALDFTFKRLGLGK